MNHTTKLFDKDGYILSIHTNTDWLKSGTWYSIQYPIKGTPHLIRKIPAVTTFVTTLEELVVVGRNFSNYVAMKTNCYKVVGAEVQSKFNELYNIFLSDGTIEAGLKIHANKTKHSHRVIDTCVTGPEGILMHVLNTREPDLAVSITFTQRKGQNPTSKIHIHYDGVYEGVERKLPYTRPDIINNDVITELGKRIGDTLPIGERKEIFTEVNEYFRDHHLTYLGIISDMNNRNKL